MDLTQEYDEKQPGGDSCASVLESNWSKLAHESRGPNNVLNKKEFHYTLYY